MKLIKQAVNKYINFIRALLIVGIVLGGGASYFFTSLYSATPNVPQGFSSDGLDKHYVFSADSFKVKLLENNLVRIKLNSLTFEDKIYQYSSNALQNMLQNEWIEVNEAEYIPPENCKKVSIRRAMGENIEFISCFKM